MDFSAPLSQIIANIAISTVFFACLYGLFYRRKLLSIADPLIIFLIAQIFSSVLIVLLVNDTRMQIQFFLAESAFLIGFSCPKTYHCATRINVNKEQTQIAEATIFILFLIWFAVSVYAGLTAGFPLLASDPTLDKTVIYTGGLGIAKRMNEGVGVLVPVGAFLLCFYGKHRKAFWAVVVISIFLSMLSGSKGALLTFIYMMGYLLAKKGILNDAQRASVRRLLPVFVAVGCLTAVLVLFISSTGMIAALDALIIRIIFYGDIVIYYYQPEIFRHFNNAGVLQFLESIMNPILGEFRLASYKEPMGVLIAGYGSPYADFSETTGPNTLFFASAYIYFGLIGGTFYSAALGWIVAKVRGWYMSYSGESILRLTCLLTLAIDIFALPTESPLFVSIIVDTFIPFFIVLTIIKITFYAVARDARQIMETR